MVENTWYDIESHYFFPVHPDKDDADYWHCIEISNMRKRTEVYYDSVQHVDTLTLKSENQSHYLIPYLFTQEIKIRPLSKMMSIYF